MASNVQGTLEEHIQCVVCLEIYTDPQALQCLHSFCYKCIQKLTQGGRVQCPQCREYTNFGKIKRDFKTQSLIDFYEKSKQVNIHKKTPTKNCESCNKPRSTVHSLCASCGTFLCIDCVSAHSETRDTKHHILTSLDALCQSSQRQIQKHIKRFENLQSEIEGKYKSTLELLHNIRTTKADQIAEVNKHRERNIQLVNQHHDMLIEEVKSKNTNVLNVLESQEQILKQRMDQLKDKIGFMSDMSESKNYSLLVDILTDLSENGETEIEKLKANLPVLQPNLRSSVVVVKGEDWDPKRSTQVKVASGVTMEHNVESTNSGLCKQIQGPNVGTSSVSEYQELQPNVDTSVTKDTDKGTKSESEYQELVWKPSMGTSMTKGTAIGTNLEPEYQKLQKPSSESIKFTSKQSVRVSSVQQHEKTESHVRCEPLQTVDTDHWSTKLSLYKNELWVGGGNQGAFMYDLDLNPVRHIEHITLKNVSSVVKTEQEVIVCDRDTGLQRFNQRGTYLGTISHGQFSDVCIYRSIMYALDFALGVVVAFNQAQNSWVESSQWQLSQYNNASDNDKLCATSKDIFISCYRSHHIQVYTHTGELLCQIGSHGRGLAEFVYPYICDTDSDGRVFICDCCNHRLQVFHPDTGNWKEISGLKGVGEPVCVAVRDKYLWVGTGYKQLLKYKIK